jgi:hypothetical protein
MENIEIIMTSKGICLKIDAERTSCNLCVSWGSLNGGYGEYTFLCFDAMQSDRRLSVYMASQPTR